MGVMGAAMRTQKWRLGSAALCGVIASLSTVALLGTAGWLISYAAQMPPVLALSVAAVLVRSFALSRSVFRYLERIMGHDAAFRGLTGLRVRVYERLERLAPVGLRRYTGGDLLARLVADVDTAVDLPLRVALPWLQAIFVSVATVGFLAWLVPGAGLGLGVVLLIGLTLVPWLSARLAVHAERRSAAARGALSTAVVSSLDGSADLLAFGATDLALSEVRRRDVDLTAIARRESAGLGLGMGLSTALQGLAVVVCVIAAIPAVVDGRIEPQWLAVAALLPLAAYDVVATLPTAALARLRVRAAAERLDEVLSEPLPVRDPHRADPAPEHEVTLQCRDVYARWSPEGAPTLRGLSFTLRPGDRVAVVGPSGAGKSTLANVLLRFVNYEGGVTLNGVPIDLMDGDDVRGVVGLMQQDAHVFDTTLRDNLRIGRIDADDDALRAVLARVGLAGWLGTLPEGLDTRVSAATMSGGERQRLALARLLLAERRILVFDEPTEHLDPGTADALTDDLLEVTRGRSTVLITHRLRGLAQVDRILVLINGQIRAEGTHGELIEQGGWYAQQWVQEVERGDLAALTSRIPPGTGLVR